MISIFILLFVNLNYVLHIIIPVVRIRMLNSQLFWVDDVFDHRWYFKTSSSHSENQFNCPTVINWPGVNKTITNFLSIYQWISAWMKFKCSRRFVRRPISVRTCYRCCCCCRFIIIIILLSTIKNPHNTQINQQNTALIYMIK